jgi:hypothetical protein
MWSTQMKGINPILNQNKKTSRISESNGELQYMNEKKYRNIKNIFDEHNSE